MDLVTLQRARRGQTVAEGPVATRETPEGCVPVQGESALRGEPGPRDSAALKTSRDNQAAENWA